MRLPNASPLVDVRRQIEAQVSGVDGRESLVFWAAISFGHLAALARGTRAVPYLMALDTWSDLASRPATWLTRRCMKGW